jgi:hypothetical protein
MNATISGTPLSDEDRERLSKVRRAIAAGTYHINPDYVAAKLILSMLEFDHGTSLSQEASSPESEGDGLPLDENMG